MSGYPTDELIELGEMRERMAAQPAIADLRRDLDTLSRQFADFGEQVDALEVGGSAAHMRAHADRIMALEQKLTGYVEQLNGYLDAVKEDFEAINREFAFLGERISTQVKGVNERFTLLENKAATARTRANTAIDKAYEVEAQLADVREGLDPAITAPLGAVVQGLIDTVENVHGPTIDVLERRIAELQSTLSLCDIPGFAQRIGHVELCIEGHSRRLMAIETKCEKNERELDANYRLAMGAAHGVKDLRESLADCARQVEALQRAQVSATVEQTEADEAQYAHVNISIPLVVNNGPYMAYDEPVVSGWVAAAVRQAIESLRRQGQI